MMDSYFLAWNWPVARLSRDAIRFLRHHNAKTQLWVNGGWLT